MVDARDLLRKKEKETILKTFRRTRKAFIIEYACGILLLLLLGFLSIKGISVKNQLTYFVLGISLVSIGSAELSRLFVRYQITENKMVIIRGFIKQSKKNVYFQALAYIPDLNVRQSSLQRLLHFGSVYLKTGGEHTFEIRDIDNPQQILDTIERLIEHNKTRRDGRSN